MGIIGHLNISSVWREHQAKHTLSHVQKNQPSRLPDRSAGENGSQEGAHIGLDFSQRRFTGVILRATTTMNSRFVRDGMRRPATRGCAKLPIRTRSAKETGHEEA
jgi:hypothetical protein